MPHVSVVASDLEGTLTSGETWRAVGRYLVEHGEGSRYRWFVRRRLPEVVLARIGLLPRQPFRDRWIRDLASVFRGRSEAELRDIAAWIVEEVLWPRRLERVLAEVAAHQAAGARVLLVSGTYQPVLEAFAKRIRAEAFGSVVEMRDGTATGALQQVNTGARKVATLREVLGDAPLAVAYGDSWADAPMLEASEAPVVVGRDERLAAVARDRGWRVIEAAQGPWSGRRDRPTGRGAGP